MRCFVILILNQYSFGNIGVDEKIFLSLKESRLFSNTHFDICNVGRCRPYVGTSLVKIIFHFTTPSIGYLANYYLYRVYELDRVSGHVGCRSCLI